MQSGKGRNTACRPAVPGRSGASTVASLLVLLFGGGAALVIASLFLTGLAQREILPRLRQRTEHAVASATRKVREGPLGRLRLHGSGGAEGASGGAMRVQGQGSLADSVAGSTPRDSLEALRTQIETERVFLEGEQKGLGRMRAGIDSALSRYGSARDSQLVRQAKLLAGMRAEEAARVLDAMDDGTVSSILGRMNSRAASKVLPKLDARRVARLSMVAIGAAEPADLSTPILPVAGPTSAQ